VQLRRWRAPAGLDFVLVALVALTTRLAHAWFVSRTPFFDGPVIDSETYRAFARHIAHTGDFGGAFYQPPLYPTFLALLIRLGLGSAWQVALVQIAMGTGTSLLLVAIGRRLAQDRARNRVVGLLCGLAAALYGPLVLFDVELLPPCCVNLLLVGSWALALRSGKPSSADALLGLLIGLCIVAWPLSAILAVALLAIRARAVDGSKIAWFFVVLAAASAPLALTARHNARHGAPGVVVSYNLGINLWLGNNPAWRDTWRARPGAQFEPELERPDREGVTRPAQRSEYFVRLVLRDVLERPLAALSRTAQKFYYVWAGREIRRDQDVALLREASPVLRSLQWEAGIAFPFGLLAPLGLLALWRRRDEPIVRCLALAALGYTALLAVFFVSARYRLPLVLVLLPLAAEQALLLLSRPGHAASRALALAALLGLNLPDEFSETFAASAVERGLLVSRAWRNQGNFERSFAHSAALVARFEGDPDAQMLHAQLLLADGRCGDAEPHLRRTIELAPRTVTPRLLLADCLVELGRGRAAQHELASALALHPYHPVGLKQAAALYLRERRPSEARALLGRFVASGYRDSQVSAWLASSSVTR
jgi:hypothetical protein